jgi:hypothetical protein
MTPKKKVASRRTPKPASSQSQAFHLISSLLHSVRRIAQHEDELCVLMQEIKRAGEMSPDVAKELQNLLERLPGQDYLDDLTAVQGLPGLILRPTSPKKTAAKKAK